MILVLGRIRIIVSYIFYIKACISIKKELHKLFKHFLALLSDMESDGAFSIDTGLEPVGIAGSI